MSSKTARMQGWISFVSMDAIIFKVPKPAPLIQISNVLKQINLKLGLEQALPL